MAVDPTFRAFVEDQLGEVLPVRTRSMFGGVGVYADDLFFALMDDGELYFKVDEDPEALRPWVERAVGVARR